jgi:hypothetical protein
MNRVKLISTVAFLILVLMTCRKTDFKQAEQPYSSTALDEIFFNYRPPSTPLIVGLRDYVRRENNKYGFVKTVVDRIGFPYWDKALTYTIARASLRDRGLLDSFDLAYIPFVRDSQTRVNAALIIKAPKFPNGDTTVQYICDWQYDEFSFNTVSDTLWNSIDVFNIFVTLDHNVFGTTEFQILDSKLISDADSIAIVNLGNVFDSIRIYYNLDTSAYEQSGRVFMPVEECNPFAICIEECELEARGSGDRKAALKSHGTCCATVLWGEVCSTVWVNIGGSTDGGGHEGPGEGGPGGGFGGGWTPPECDHGLGRSFDPCSIGWIGTPVGSASTMPPIILLNVTNPCLISVISTCTGPPPMVYPADGAMVDYITSLFNSTYIAANSFATLEIQEVNNSTTLDPNRIAYSSRGGPRLFNIAINPQWNNQGNNLSNGLPVALTQELLGAVFMHEVLHGFLSQYETNLNITNLTFVQHETMLTNWVVAGATFLTDRFGISNSDALALSLSLLGDLLQGSYTINGILWSNYIQNNFSLTITQIANVFMDYATGVKGTPC